MTEIRTQGRDDIGRETTTITISEPMVITATPQPSATQAADQVLGQDAVSQEAKARNMAQVPSESLGNTGVNRFGEQAISSRPKHSLESYEKEMDRKLKTHFASLHSAHGGPDNFSVRWSVEFVEGKPTKIQVQSYDLTDEERNQFATLVQTFTALYPLDTPASKTFNRTYST